MSSYDFLDPLFFPRILCTVLIVVTGLMLAIAWFGSRTSYDPVSVSIVFAGSLVARCLLVRGGHAAAADARRHADAR